MVGSLSAGLLLADEAGAHLPSVDDFLPPEILFQGTPFAINRIILIRIVATIVLLVVLGVTAKRAKLIPSIALSKNTVKENLSAFFRSFSLCH